MEGYCRIAAVAAAISESRPFGQRDPLIRERYDHTNEVLDRVVERLADRMRREGWEVSEAEFRRLAL